MYLFFCGCFVMKYCFIKYVCNSVKVLINLIVIVVRMMVSVLVIGEFCCVLYV